jgi:hypothetical protein
MHQYFNKCLSDGTDAFDWYHDYLDIALRAGLWRGRATAIPITIVSAADRQAAAETINFYDFRTYYINKNPNITTTT